MKDLKDLKVLIPMSWGGGIEKTSILSIEISTARRHINATMVKSLRKRASVLTVFMSRAQGFNSPRHVVSSKAATARISLGN